MNIRQDLNKFGNSFIKEARRKLRRHYKTGQLNDSFKFKINRRGTLNYNLQVTNVYYGKYLLDKTDWIEPSLDKTLPQLIDDIGLTVETEILSEINIMVTNSNTDEIKINIE